MSTPAPPEGAAAPRRRRGTETARDMVLSLGVIIAIVAAFVLLVPRSGESLRQPADVSVAVTQALEEGLPVGEPAVPRGWEANDARYAPDTAEGLPTFHAGWVTDDGRYAGVDVTRGATPGWVDQAAGGDASEDGERDVAGSTWRVLRTTGDAPRTSYVLEQDGVTTVVSGTAPADDLDALAEAVIEARPAA